MKPETMAVSPKQGELAAYITCIDTLPLPTAVVEPGAGRFVHANQAFKQQWVARSVSDLTSLIHSDDLVSVSALLAERPADTSPETTRSTLIRVPMIDGSTRWAKAFVSPFRLDLAPNATLLMLQLVDFTDDKLMVDDLVARETRWNSALVSSESGVWDHDYRAGRKYYSPIWRWIRGMSPADPLPASKEAWLNLVHPDDRSFTLHAMERQEAGDPAFQVFEYRERHKDGHWVWIECRGACIDRDENGRAMRVVGTDNDITPRKDAEHRAAKIARRLEMALAISGVGVFEADLTAGEVDWDVRMYEIFGVPKGEKIRLGVTWESFLRPDDRERVLANVSAHHGREGCFWDRYHVTLAGGEERIIKSCSMTFTDVDGHLKLVGANWDVTNDVLLQQELERAKSLAEARNAELEATRDQIEHNALHDYLTGLPNRRYLDLALDQLSKSCSLKNRSLGLLHIDLDGFKQINDGFGHSVGDAVLSHVAEQLRQIAGARNFVARAGGDEFVVLVPFAGTPDRLSILANRIVVAMSRPFRYGDTLCHFGASIGVAYASGSSINGHQILLDADTALYEAKHSGKGRHAVFDAATYR